MKIRDIKDVLEFLNKDGMDSVKRGVMFIGNNCPKHIDLIKAGGSFCVNDCLDCWKESLDLKENQNKLENEIKEEKLCLKEF